MRQIDTAAAHSRARDAQQRHHSHQRQGRHEHASVAAWRGDGLSIVCAVSAHDGRGEHGVWTEDSGHAAGARSSRASRRAAEILQLQELLERKPRALSGGQRQRVAIGRAIVREPDVFLFDEPLSNLDAALRGQMRVEIARLHARLGTTMIYVTHDQVEAMTLASRIVVLNGGRIEQVGAPLELYRAAGESVRRGVPWVAADEFSAGEVCPRGWRGGRDRRGRSAAATSHGSRRARCRCRRA